MTNGASALSGYDAWADVNGVGAGDEDPDVDGRNNLYEYALAGNPTNAMDDIDPTLTNVGDLKYTHEKRRDDTNLNYIVQTCTDLTTGGWADTETEITTNSSGAEYNNISHTISTNDPQSYIRLKIINP